MQGFDSFDDEDDCGEDGDAFASFEDFGARETRKLRGYLEDMDRKIFDVEATVSTEATASQEQKTKPRRYYSVGYDAHQELVSDKDLVEWQRAFPMLRVCGTHIPNPNLDSDVAAVDEVPLTGTAFQDFEAEEIGDSAVDMIEGTQEHEPDLTLSIKGSSLRLHQPVDPQSIAQLPRKRDFTECTNSAQRHAAPISGACGGEAETTICMDGVLEEIIAIDRSNSKAGNANTNDGSPPLSPTSARKYEMSCLLLDSIWPNVVEALRPLVERVVNHQLTHGIPETEQNNRRSEWSDDDLDNPQPSMKISSW